MAKILFMGTPQFAATILSSLIEADYDIIAVVTQPDRPVGRKKILTPSDVKIVAMKHEIPVFQPGNISQAEELELLLNMDIDFIVTAAYGQLLPESLLKVPSIASVNVHASLLPKYRGGAPIHYAIWNGDKETGVSIIYMVKEMDAGDIISQESIPITARDDVGKLFDKLALLGKDLLLRTLPRLETGQIEAVAQNIEDVTYSPTISRQEEKINWQETAQEIDCHIRAFRPFPTTYSILDQERIKIWRGIPVEYQASSVEYGKIVDIVDQRIIVQCGQNTFFGIEEWQESGKKRIQISDWLNGNTGNTIIGKVFES